MAGHAQAWIRHAETGGTHVRTKGSERGHLGKGTASVAATIVCLGRSPHQYPQGRMLLLVLMWRQGYVLSRIAWLVPPRVVQAACRLADAAHPGTPPPSDHIVPRPIRPTSTGPEPAFGSAVTPVSRKIPNGKRKPSGQPPVAGALGSAAFGRTCSCSHS